MEMILVEISQFLKYSDLGVKTKSLYEKRLIDFTNYLSDLTNKPIDEVHLDKFHFLPYDDKVGIHLPINSVVIDNYLMSNLSLGCSYSWLSSTSSALQSFFRYLSLKYDMRNIMREIDFKLRDHYVEPKHKRIFNRQEILKFIWSILKFCNSEALLRDVLLFITLFTTGCRVSEVLALTPSDLMVDEHTFLLQKTKNKRQLYVATKVGLTKSLKIYSEKNSIKSNERIFLHNREPMTQVKVNELLNYYSERASLPKTRVHDTRGSFITTMYENGSDLAVIQQMVNHFSMNSTQVYLADYAVRNKTIQIPIIEAICKDLNSLVGKS